MNPTLSESMGKVIFQTDTAGQIRRRGKAEDVLIEGHHDNGVYKTDYEILAKKGFVKKGGIDLVKNDHMILQKKGEGIFFFLFQADRDSFSGIEEDTEVFEETGDRPGYRYRVRMEKNLKARPEKKKSNLGGRAGRMMDEVNELLEKHGITEMDASSPVNEYMKSWRLGHPDGE